ncbi:matrixin family metalloprotease [Candidatus Pacearchaeota archaeon]|nr:matrixin family metalloprotease [Candidatus Pacearchaeota archaeon]
MKSKAYFAMLFLVVIVSLMTIYYIAPFTKLEFDVMPSNYNFSLDVNASLVEMQFYPNMRFPSKRITYNIHDACSLKKKQDMMDAFDIVENKTSMVFSSSNENADIEITCNETTKYESGMYIAGEGGPTNVVKTDKFYVINGGTILLIRDSDCERPNIAIHELFHVLGFKHSNNPNNIMYNYTKCNQVIGDDNIQLLERLYSVESKPDLLFEENKTNVLMHGRYLDLNLTVKNYGLRDAKDFIVSVIVDEKPIKEILIGEVNVGNGKVLSLRNLWVTKRNPSEVQLRIDPNFEEITKENNMISFKIKD